MPDPFDLDRFIVAQRGSYQAALAELSAGRKRTHWMWFIFPQIAGLGHSPMAQAYALRGLDEARAYWAHPVLGARLRACIDALQESPETSADRVFGGIDAIKLRSSLTLFEAATADPIFTTAIDRWFAGERDPATLTRLG